MNEIHEPEQVPTPTAEWTAPVVECLETRPEVTAYAGDGGPWLTR
jgi:hypothetical protein